jgi:hypothetical protein
VVPSVGPHRIAWAIGLCQRKKANEASPPLSADPCDPVAPIGRFDAVIRLQIWPISPLTSPQERARSRIPWKSDRTGPPLSRSRKPVWAFSPSGVRIPPSPLVDEIPGTCRGAGSSRSAVPSKRGHGGVAADDDGSFDFIDPHDREGA